MTVLLIGLVWLLVATVLGLAIGAVIGRGQERPTA